jgi:CRISPR-associated endoribonuclease Cas6
MLLSAVIRMRPLLPGALSADQGRALNDTFLGWVGWFDPVLATQLHDSGDRKPFTVSPFNGVSLNRRGELLFTSGQEVWWRVTSTLPELSTLLEERVLPALRQGDGRDPFVLGGKIPFEIVDVCTDERTHPWAGRSSCETLFRLHETSEPGDALEVEFASPTTFHSAGKQMLFPLPELVLGSWLDAWNTVAGARLMEDLRAFGRESMVVSRYRLETGVARYDKRKYLGFYGKCRFRIQSEDEHWLKLVNLLSDFSFYCGTGAKTTFGLGQTRLLDA